MKCVNSRLYNDVPRPHPYEHCPLSLVDHVLSHVMSSDESDWPDSQQAIVALLKHYQTQLEDHQQATTLEQLGLGQYCTFDRFDIVHILFQVSIFSDFLMMLCTKEIKFSCYRGWLQFGCGLNCFVFLQEREPLSVQYSSVAS